MSMQQMSPENVNSEQIKSVSTHNLKIVQEVYEICLNNCEC